MEETEEEDDDVIQDVLKIEKPAQRKEVRGPMNWEGRTNQGWAKNELTKQCPSKMLGWDRNKRPNEQRSRKFGSVEDILSKIGFSGESRPRKRERRERLLSLSERDDWKETEEEQSSEEEARSESDSSTTDDWSRRERHALTPST